MWYVEVTTYSYGRWEYDNTYEFDTLEDAWDFVDEYEDVVTSMDMYFYG